MGADSFVENTVNASKMFSPKCLSLPKTFEFLKKSSLWVSVVRGFSQNCQDFCPTHYRVEILTNFCSHFGRKDDVMNSFSFSSSNTQFCESQIFCLFTFRVFFPDESFELISKYNQKYQHNYLY